VSVQSDSFSWLTFYLSFKNYYIRQRLKEAIVPFGIEYLLIKKEAYFYFPFTIDHERNLH